MSELIGIPFVPKGRSLNGCDCYGLNMLYYKTVLSIDIPDVVAGPSQKNMAHVEFLNHVAKNWTKIDEPIEHCVVSMKTDSHNPNLVTHHGVVVKVDGVLKILHTFRKVESHLIDIDHIAYKNKIVGFYQWHN